MSFARFAALALAALAVRWALFPANVAYILNRPGFEPVSLLEKDAPHADEVPERTA